MRLLPRCWHTVAASEGNREEAQRLASRQSKRSNPPAVSNRKSSWLGSYAAGDARRGTSIFQELFDLNTQSFDSGILLDCAARLHRDDVVIAACAELEKRGQEPLGSRQLRGSISPEILADKGARRLDAFLSAHPGHKLGMLMRSVIGVQSQEPALVNGNHEALPAVEVLPPDCIIPAIHVLRFAGAGNATVDYARTGSLRLHFNDIRAHQALMLSLMPGDPSIILPASLDTVVENAAVAV